MIVSFGDDETRRVFLGTASRKLPGDIQRVARRKLIYLDSARDLRDLLSPPGNQLEALKGDRRGQGSIRINDQWRSASYGTSPEATRPSRRVMPGTSAGLMGWRS